MKFFFSFFILTICQLSAQCQLLFTTLKPADGLASRETRAVFRDSEGYLWIGTTAGLNRFDGAHFKLWNKTTFNYPKSLGEVVTTIIEHRGRIYFGTDAGLGVLDKTSGQVTQLFPNNGIEDSYAITRLEEDTSGRLWVATDKGLRVETSNGLIPVSRIYAPATVLDSISIFHGAFLFDAGRNCFWIGTPSGSYCLDLRTSTLFSSENNPAANPFFVKDNIASIALDNSNDLWFSNNTKGLLCHYNLASKAFESLDKINGNPDWNFSGGAPILKFDADHRLWITTWSFTSYVRHPDGKFEPLVYDATVPYSIGYGFFYDAFVDKYSNVWLATINGLSKLGKSAFVQTIVKAPSFKYYLPVDFANINAVQPDDESWWVCKMDGLLQYKPTTKTFRRFVPSGKDLEANDIYDCQTVEDEVWCSSNYGVKIFNKKRESFHSLDHSDKAVPASGYVSCMVKDHENTVWSCLWKKYLCRYNLKTKSCEHFANQTALLESRCIYVASDKKIWIGTTDGAWVYHPSKGWFVHAARGVKGNVSAITEDVHKNIWLAATDHGLIKCTSEGEVIDSINRSNGLPMSWITDVVADDAGRLWMISREGLFCVSTSTKTISKVTIPVSYSFNDHWNSLLKKGNLIYASMLDNVVVVNTALYQKTSEAMPPLISSLYVFGKEDALKKNIELSYQQNFFSFDFASPFHSEVSAMQYAYMLEGFDEEWVNSGRNLNASYTNVPDGRYVFKVRTTGANGQWMDKASSVNIVIRPPFWKTWWFISLLAVAVAVLIYYLYLYRRKVLSDNRMEEAIDYFANSLYGDNSANEICWDIARNCISQLKLEDCVVYLLDDKRNVLVQKAAYGPKNPKEHEISNPIEITPGSGIVGTAASLCKPVLIKDTSKDSRYIVDDAHRLSELAVPIIHEGKAIGVIDSEHSQKDFFRDDHVKVLSTIAAISANKIAEAKAEEAARQSEIQLLEIKKLLAESQLMALRAQMNPHFVFNCLNSIQECIVTQKYGEASLYLNKFSKLFRSVLNNSGRILVTLAEEIEVLDLYLTLEHMRFEKSFRYAIHTDEDLELDEILVPSMLLQPYVENALWHGLMHKANNRELVIEFNKKDGDVFECVIEDNGIGRRKALELKEQQSKTKRHVSRGMTISKDRIELLQKQGQHASLDIVDKYEDGEAAGTRVVVELSAFLE